MIGVMVFRVLARVAGLETLLSDPGHYPGVGPERGKRVSDGISKYVSPHGSYRYVMYVGGRAVAGLQVVSRDKKNALVANVYTDPTVRRQGFASQLLQRARQDFRTVEHASEDDLSLEGRAWRDADPKRR
jgi:GNAT superfamily N-acetyltransferase